ncbi:MAG: potassium-transporting ATPase subunit KdpC [Desulfuromonadales bacterium]|nr:potassium-transporting ATPase subunit KdpC [Desulfuromonadales bacterium]
MKDLKPAILMLVLFTLICGGVYPMLVTGISTVIFPKEAAGSLILDNVGKVRGSMLIGQSFSDEKYFWPRPSATPDFSYNAASSGASNKGPTNKEYLKDVADKVAFLHNNGISGTIPSELVQASGSGLDPDISPESARLQVPRVAKTRGVSENILLDKITKATIKRQFGFLGAERVNVLALNLWLDGALK